MKAILKTIFLAIALTGLLFTTISCSGHASGSGGASLGASGGAAVSVN